MALAPWWNPGFDQSGAPPPVNFGGGRGRYLGPPIPSGSQGPGMDTPYSRVRNAVKAIFGPSTPINDSGGGSPTLPPPGGNGAGGGTYGGGGSDIPPPVPGPRPRPANYGSQRGIWAYGDPSTWSNFLGYDPNGNATMGMVGFNANSQPTGRNGDPNWGTITRDEAGARMGAAGITGNPGTYQPPGNFGYSTPGPGGSGGGYVGKDYSQGGAGGGGYGRPGAGGAGGGYGGPGNYGPNTLPGSKYQPRRKSAYETAANYRAAQAGQPLPFPNSEFTGYGQTGNGDPISEAQYQADWLAFATQAGIDPNYSTADDPAWSAANNDPNAYPGW